ncbi:hypothetical protein [Niveispirillum sp.]|nr:hypothetical protein [Niveispirillum sp.]MBP7335001.1 hypothetical protein [Niveispirillum sp.]
MDGFTPLALEEDQMLTAVPPSLVEAGEWVAVRAGDSAMMIWFPTGD